jgi:hypothetical protein
MEDDMKREKEISKAKGAKAALNKPEPKKRSDPLEPCGKPQAQEAFRLNAADDACDEGVH